MCCTKIFCRGNLVVGDVDRNDCACAAHSRTLNCIETNSTGANNNDMTTGRNFCGIRHCTKSSNDTARKQRCTCHRNCLWNCHALRLVHEHKLCEAARAHALHNCIALCIGDWRLGIERKLRTACNWVAHAATMAVSTRANQRDNNVFSHFDGGDISSNYFDKASALVTINGWQRATPCSVGVRNIAMTDCDGGNLDANFARTSIGKLHFFDDEWFTKLATYCCFHGIVLPFGSGGFKRTHLM